MTTLLNKKGFTLVELLVVIAIIGILAVTLLLTLNPAEAQRKARDAQRLKDAQTLQTILEQFINDGGDVSSIGSQDSGSGGNSCATNWLTIDVCSYVNSVPEDPVNGSSRSCANCTGTQSMVYQVEFNGSEYLIKVRQESDANTSKLENDGGDNSTTGTGAEWYEISSNFSVF